MFVGYYNYSGVRIHSLGIGQCSKGDRCITQKFLDFIKLPFLRIGAGKDFLEGVRTFYRR